MLRQSSRLTKRSIDMTSDSGLISQDSDYPKAIQEVLDELCQMQQTPRLVTSPEELEALEREIRQCTDRWGSLLVGYPSSTVLHLSFIYVKFNQLVTVSP